MLLTYCSNVHPLDGWDALQRALAGYVPAIRAAISPKQPFPLGLWLSEAALTEAERQGTAAFQEWCTAAGCFVLGFNGFPYGAFHAGRVKEQVYLPDWRSPARTEYTCRLATLLDRLLPSGMPGSITTVPLGWGPRLSGADLPQLRSQLVVVLEWLDQLRQASGKTIRLALEPEPGCLLETAADAAFWLDRLALPRALRPLIGVCYDACHQAVVFEEPAPSLALLRQAEVPLVRVQASSALRLLPGADPRRLAPFADDRWLHQTVVCCADGRQLRFADLPAALAEATRSAGRDAQWRIHLHVPLYVEQGDEELTSTRPFLAELLPLLPPEIPVEVETYTWQLLPASLRDGSLASSLIAELRCCQGMMR